MAEESLGQVVLGKQGSIRGRLQLNRYPMWHYRRYGVEALLALGRKAEAVRYAEASRGLNQPDSVIDQACEEILIELLSNLVYNRLGRTL